MTCKISILDFEKQGLFGAAEPEMITGKCRVWKKDINALAPWTRVRATWPDEKKIISAR